MSKLAALLIPLLFMLLLGYLAFVFTSVQVMLSYPNPYEQAFIKLVVCQAIIMLIFMIVTAVLTVGLIVILMDKKGC